MKTKLSSTSKVTIRSALAIVIAVAVTAFIPFNSSAQEKGSAKGGAGQLMSKPIRT